jgi:hypothetical protein
MSYREEMENGIFGLVLVDHHVVLVWIKIESYRNEY